MRYNAVVYRISPPSDPIALRPIFNRGFEFNESAHKVMDVMGAAVDQLVAEGGRPDERVPASVTPRVHLAWLIYCYDQGYTTPAHRAILTNWLGDDPATLHPDDVVRQRNLLRMADEVLALMAAEAADG
jgi:hypothetical protein